MLWDILNCIRHVELQPTYIWPDSLNNVSEGHKYRFQGIFIFFFGPKQGFCPEIFQGNYRYSNTVRVTKVATWQL